MKGVVLSRSAADRTRAVVEFVEREFIPQPLLRRRRSHQGGGGTLGVWIKILIAGVGTGPYLVAVYGRGRWTDAGAPAEPTVDEALAYVSDGILADEPIFYREWFPATRYGAHYEFNAGVLH